MASMTHATGALSVALVIALSTAAPSLAQTPAELETITVVAPRITYQVKRVPGSAIPQQVTIAEQRAEVDISDLDLTRTADLFKLEERVNVAATRVCNQLIERLPEGQPSAAVCKRRAAEDAMAQVQHVTQMVAGD